MGSSIARKQKKADNKRRNKQNAQGVGVKHVGNNGIDVDKLSALLKNVQEMGDVMNHNQGVVRNSFFIHDVWSEAFRRVLADLASTLAASYGTSGPVKYDGNGNLDFQRYLSDAQTAVQAKISEQQNKNNGNLEEAVQEFGGDYVQDDEEQSETDEAVV